MVINVYGLRIDVSSFAQDRMNETWRVDQSGRTGRLCIPAFVVERQYQSMNKSQAFCENNRARINTESQHEAHYLVASTSATIFMLREIRLGNIAHFHTQERSPGVATI